jgi:class 3 adenylate cyclase
VRGLTIHVVVYAVVNALLVGVWAVTSESTLQFADIRADPIQAVQNGFWPLWIIAAWGAAVIIHAAVVAANLAFGGPRRRRAREQARQREKRSALAPPARPLPPGTPVPEPSATTLKAEATRMAMNLVETLGTRIAQQTRPDVPDGGQAGTPPAAPAAAAAAPPPAGPGRHWVAVMFTDIANSTTLAETLGDDAWGRVLSEHRTLVRDCLRRHNGTEVGTQGDGFLVRFDHPIDAVACAVSLQRRLAAERDRGAFTPEVRVGIHAGEALADDNDLVGRVINLASRVTSAATPGEILVTEPVADHLGPSVAMTDRGLQPLKGFSQPRHLLSVTWGEPATVDLDQSPGPSA